MKTKTLSNIIIYGLCVLSVIGTLFVNTWVFSVGYWVFIVGWTIGYGMAVRQQNEWDRERNERLRKTWQSIGYKPGDDR